MCWFYLACREEHSQVKKIHEISGWNEEKRITSKEYEELRLLIFIIQIMKVILHFQMKEIILSFRQN